MGAMPSGLYSALNALQHEGNRMNLHVRNVEHVSHHLDKPHAELKKSDIGNGVTEANDMKSSSLGRLEIHKAPPSQERDVLNLNSDCGIELAAELVHIVNVQHNFDANAKSVSTIDTMYETLLNMRV